jgi:hypothetical protein
MGWERSVVCLTWKGRTRGFANVPRRLPWPLRPRLVVAEAEQEQPSARLQGPGDFRIRNKTSEISILTTKPIWWANLTSRQ